MQTALRYLLMLQHIPRQPQKIDPASLRERLRGQGFDVSVRTIQRDLNDLSDVFPLVVDERSRPYGWSFIAESPLAMPSLDMPTALALMIVEQHLKLQLPSAVLRKLQHNFAAAKKLLADTAAGYDSWHQRVVVLPLNASNAVPVNSAAPNYKSRGSERDTRPAEYSPEVLDLIFQGIDQGVQLQLKYFSRSHGRIREGMLSPFGIVHHGTVTYLIGCFQGTTDIRQIALQRLQWVKLSNTPAEHIAGFDMRSYLQTQRTSLLCDKQQHQLELHFSANAGKHLHDAPLCPNQVLEQRGDKLVLKAKVNLSDDILWWVMSFGAQVEVKSPEPLRDELRAQVSVLQQLYASHQQTEEI